ncbi:methylated-DNA--[protein]-cysteine S-methyltransferase [Halobacillus litoralis]|uniref:Methylated-DNA--[protein]-cysteine S-methyltransferase n=1 Tax=Halobacillus litoralis TaxID=45668 RepID=A0A845F763_9BACI|nr:MULTISPECIES: MGMT family protein [Halobacillus]MEC3884458.1 MGMT family protein [Halobacillus sp. HZG1]MYL69527.1 methylated-DNA--[protein]-cysteine S-methyltransferase [Halobacillus litoralis]
MQPFTERILQIIHSIPKGRVMSYGQIAACAGNPRAARQVARALHSMSEKHDLPWHRVVNAKGQIAVKDPSRQRELLENEGVIVIHDKISMKDYQHDDPLCFEE